MLRLPKFSGGGRTMSLKVAIAILVLAVLTGCAAKWTERSSAPTAEFRRHAMAYARPGLLVLYVGDPGGVKPGRPM
jgi:hypothetical protein